MRIDIQDLFDDWEENEVHIPEEQTDIKAICSKTMQKVNVTPKKRHPMRSVLIAVAAAVLLCSSALAVPAVREAIFGNVETERHPSFHGHSVISENGSSVRPYSYTFTAIPSENAPARIKTVYHLAGLPEGYYEDGWIEARETDSGDLDYEIVRFIYSNVFDTSVTFCQYPATWASGYDFNREPEVRNVVLGEVECQVISGIIAGMTDISQFVVWSDGDYLFELSITGNLTDAELERLVTSLSPLEDCSPYLSFICPADTTTTSMSETYAPSKVPDEWSNPYVDLYENGLDIYYACDGLKGDGSFTFSQVPQDMESPGIPMDLSADVKEEVRTVGGYEVTFRSFEDSNGLYASWCWNGYSFKASYFATQSNHFLSIDEFAEIIASVQPKENLKEAEYSIKQYYLPEMADGWEQSDSIVSVPETITIGFEWKNKDYAGVQFSQNVTDAYSACGGYCMINEDAVIEERMIGGSNVIFTTTGDNLIGALWEQGDYTMELICADGDTTKWTVDDVAALVESIHEVDDITPYLTQPSDSSTN